MKVVSIEYRGWVEHDDDDDGDGCLQDWTATRIFP